MRHPDRRTVAGHRVACAGHLLRPGLRPVRLAGLDPGLAAAPHRLPTFQGRLRGAEEIGPRFGLQPGSQDLLPPGADQHLARLAVVLRLVPGRVCIQVSPPWSTSPLRMMTTSPGLIPVSRYSRLSPRPDGRGGDEARPRRRPRPACLVCFTRRACHRWVSVARGPACDSSGLFASRRDGGARRRGGQGGRSAIAAGRRATRHDGVARVKSSAPPRPPFQPTAAITSRARVRSRSA